MRHETTHAVHIRETTQQDWRAVRDLRLLALRTELGRFFRHPDDEAGLPDEHWIALVCGDDTHQLFGLFNGDRLVGISGVRADPDDPSGTTASFGMSYILPEYRGTGLGARFYEARLAWAQARPRFFRAAVGHRRSNAASRTLIERFGFVWTHDKPHLWPDGTQEDDACYELSLRTSLVARSLRETSGEG